MIAAYLENSPLAGAIRDSTWAYPILEIIHITGIVMLAGAAFMFDLRLLGFSKELPVAGLARHLLPWSKRGLLLIVPSGLLLFITNAITLTSNPVFWLKMLLLVTAGLNALLFHRLIDRIPEKQRTPTRAKLMALLSIVLWIAVITCGRLLAY
ncbi:DUF6644 family protein [uncultured Chitinophaga sp.]|uniref:DUF6644 family protein n=1 Tax=uncultured Chitinophaga sp. TaxID=339340 RepID=UPI00261CBDB4|nr:DUF6644 family protein [uncultured Chitinophaga sp.]